MIFFWQRTIFWFFSWLCFGGQMPEVQWISKRARTQLFQISDSLWLPLIHAFPYCNSCTWGPKEHLSPVSVPGCVCVCEIHLWWKYTKQKSIYMSWGEQMGQIQTYLNEHPVTSHWMDINLRSHLRKGQSDQEWELREAGQLWGHAMEPQCSANQDTERDIRA